jgi:hypothetical protein
MDPVVAMAAIAAVPAYVSLGFSYYVFRRQQSEQERRNEWERKQHKQQQHHELVVNQPRLVPIGSSLVILNDTVPQRLATDAQQQTIQLQSLGRSMPSDVYAVLFPCASNQPPNTPAQSRVEELFGTYWEGRLDASLGQGEQLSLMLSARSFPLSGNLSVIPGYTLFAPPVPAALGTSLGAHFYFARLTMTFRDDFGRMLAANFDGESVPHEKVLTQKWRTGTGPVEVSKDLRMLADEATANRKPPVIA